MIRVKLRNIKDFNLELFNSKDIIDQNVTTSKKILKHLEKKYKLKSHIICRRSNMQDSEFEININPKYRIISPEDRYRWLMNYEIYVKSSKKYKMWIIFHKLFFENEN